MKEAKSSSGTSGRGDSTGSCQRRRTGQANFYHDEVCPAMENLRRPMRQTGNDKVDKEAWPMPSYGDLDLRSLINQRNEEKTGCDLNENRVRIFVMGGIKSMKTAAELETACDRLRIDRGYPAYKDTQRECISFRAICYLLTMYREICCISIQGQYSGERGKVQDFRAVISRQNGRKQHWRMR